MEPGARVIDTDLDDANSAIVVARHATPISEFEIDDDGTTVADVNEDYPADDSAVVVVFEEVLEGLDDAWDVATQGSLQHLVREEPVKTYTYPESRLSVRDEAGDVIRVRRTEDGENRYVNRLRVDSVGESLVYGDDFDGVDHNHGTPRPVCLNRPGDVDLEAGNLIRVVYGNEKDIGEEYPPLLAAVQTVEVKAANPSPDILLDL
ncbi:hypothetical protein [Salinibaculum rarum]|uniref:hypothetical protein n=1 Tax=Salinibaculum rarum TaxID=3058903 RepID=UPI0026601B9E|nr:hypothetical protein [Salinibaculum sp. KK48]